ncbi:unnamed protein product [Rotaria sp. Silwood1]|nr:unnamed protein product [Rotaria sp. Silwood1]CAF3338194.1 unnamed protein product [Rotaria sp. Silwood1]CAF4611712.1 unnamed protein product [Rotaria sp. Silwood1]
MNDSIDSYGPSNGCYTGNTPIYRNNFTSNFKLNASNNYCRHSYSPSAHENICLQEKQQSNTVNQRYLYMNCADHHHQQQQAPQHLTHDIYGFENNALSPITYYNRIFAQVRSNTPVPQLQNQSFPSTALRQSRERLPIITNCQPHENFLFKPAPKPIRRSPEPQSPIPYRTSVVDPALSYSSNNDDNPSLDYLHYTMDSLIERLIPNDTYIPQQSFIYSMLLCSRMHIQPSMLLNKLTQLTMNSIKDVTRDRSIRTMKNFLHILLEWTRTFPYDFRNTDMRTQLEEVLKKINSYEPILQSDTHNIKKKLLSKLKALENYEEYIRQLNTKALNNHTHTALITDIINECPTPVLFAQQLTYIELDRLKPIGAEELIQYYIMKLSSEEARAHPNRISNDETRTSDDKSLAIVHDKKLTFCLETYIQWFNRLTSFVTTEIVKHTQKRLRIRLINYFIDGAYECFRLHNFNSMIGIIGGLNMQPVKRLKRTWKKIQLNKLEQLEQYMNVSKNFANYRLIFKSAKEEAEKYGWAVDKIVIPFTSLVLQDVYYIKTHSKDDTVAGGVNLKKYYSMAKFISEEFIQCKQSKVCNLIPCSFERNDIIINYITTSPIFNENSLMLASFECEPPATANEKEKWSMLQATKYTSSSKL